MPQMKEQENFPEEKLNEMGESNLTDTELRVMIIRILNSIIKNIKTTVMDQSEIKMAISNEKCTGRNKQ